jgi:hypothetical protein
MQLFTVSEEHFRAFSSMPTLALRYSMLLYATLC